MSRTFVYLISLLGLSLLAISCETTPDSVVKTLLSAEKCMEAYPDSALNLLKQIPHPETLRGKAQADYSLLMTQAMDKNYIKLESDSLISIAVGYYGSHDENKVKKGKAFFYYGRVMKELNNVEDAMRYYLKAKNVFENTKEYKMLGLIADEMSLVNWSQDMYDESLINNRTAFKYYNLAKDTLSMSYALRNIGRYYLSIKGSDDSTYNYYQKALFIAHKNNCNSEFTILQELGLFYRLKKDYPKAEYYLLQALNLDEKASLFSEIYLSLGYNYLLMNNKEKAEKYLKMSTEAANTYTQADAYKLLFEFEKLNNDPWQAIKYKEKSDSINKIIQKTEIKEAVADLQKKYETEKLQRENLSLKVKNQSIALLCVFLLFFIFIGVYYFCHKNRQNKKEMRNIKLQIAMNKEEIALYQKEMIDYQQLQNETEDYRSQIGELNGKVALLNKQSKTLMERLNKIGGQLNKSLSGIENVYVATFRMLLLVKEGLYKEELSHSDWERLFEFFDYSYNGMVTRLRNEYSSLTKHDYEICCLLKFGFSNEELRRIFHTTPDAVTKAKGRLKKRLNIAPQEDLDEFMLKY